MERPREKERDGDRQIFEPDRSAIPFVDFECKEASAVAVSGVTHSYAGAGQVAAAVFNVPSFDLPVPVGDCPLRCRHMSQREPLSLAPGFMATECDLTLALSAEMMGS